MSYENALPMANKLLNKDGTVTTFNGTVVTDAVAEYNNRMPFVNKFLNPDGTVSLLQDILPTSGEDAGNGGISGSSNYNDLTNKPSINGVSLDGNKTSADLGVLDLNTTETQTIKSGLNVYKEFFLTDNNNQKIFTIQHLQDQSYGDMVTLGTSNIMVVGGVNGIIIFNSITVQNPTALADLPDNALLTKAQVQEMINNALNGNN